MAEQSKTAPFQAIFESALQAYEKMTGVTLAQHPLAVQIQSCQSVEDVTSLLEGEVRTFDDSRQRDTIMQPIKTIVSILTRLSDAASLPDALSPVCPSQKPLMACSMSLTLFFSHYSHLRQQYKLVSLSYLKYVRFPSSYVDILVTSKRNRQKRA